MIRLDCSHKIEDVAMISQEQYIDAWEHNAKQHFADGDYEWACNQISHYKTVFEIGCGAGYSTLALAKKSIMCFL